jgi:hypothetical protein
VNLCEEVQKICCFSYLKSVLKKIYVGSDSFALQNGLSHRNRVERKQKSLYHFHPPSKW